MNAEVKPEKKPEVKHDLTALRRRVRRLIRYSGKKLDNSICDIIDLGGYSLAVLLARIPRLPEKVQERISQRIEDFLFFHPDRGRKMLPRLYQSVKVAAPCCRPHLLCAMADILARSGDRFPVEGDLGAEALELLESDADWIRRGKAVELLSHFGRRSAIPVLIRLLGESLDGVDGYANFTFVETVLFALKRLGGESLLRLLINQQSGPALEGFRLEWRDHTLEESHAVLNSLRPFDENFSQLLLKVIDLSEFALPFISMVQEGLNHSDKWIRQVAVDSFAKIGKKTDAEQLFRMLTDPALEVRLMAVHALGTAPAAKTGQHLVTIALSESETMELRMNALYALFRQKNLLGLETAAGSLTSTVSLNARGLIALLGPREDGLKDLLVRVCALPSTQMPDLFHYLLELARPEDLLSLISAHANLREETTRASYLVFLGRFLQTRAGPSLDAAMKALKPQERLALDALRSGLVPLEPH